MADGSARGELGLGTRSWLGAWAVNLHPLICKLQRVSEINVFPLVKVLMHACYLIIIKFKNVINPSLSRCFTHMILISKDAKADRGKILPVTPIL